MTARGTAGSAVTELASTLFMEYASTALYIAARRMPAQAPERHRGHGPSPQLAGDRG